MIPGQNGFIMGGASSSKGSSKTGFEFTQKFEKNELSALLSSSKNAHPLPPTRKGYTPTHYQEHI
jgi:hypothetical protein